jgi:cardiolipin synthase
VKGFPNEELVARVTGPVVAQLQAVFLEDWFFETSEILRDELFPELPDAGTSAAQVLPSGPGYRRQNAYELIVHLLHEAESRIAITTPYFVPDEPFLLGLQTAVVRGVDVHLIVSEPKDQLLSSLAQQSHYDALLEAGVKIHLYRPRFLHAKHLTIDTHVALISSINMDIRSFALNAEVGLIVYDPAVVAAVRRVQERYLADATTLTLAEWRRRPPHTRVVQNLARLADSLL